MQTNQIAFAQLGCGRVAQRYLDIFTGGEIGGGALIGVCDRADDRRAAFAERTGATPYASREALLAESDAQVVCISTPSGDHADDIRAVLESGRHVVVEKPATMIPADILALGKLAEERGLMLCVVKQNRYNPAMGILKRTMESGRFGRMVLGTVRVRWARDMGYYSSDPWRGKFLSDGGVITNQAIHHIDALQWIMGPVRAVCAEGRAILSDIEVDDTTVGVLRFENGALGVIEATTATRPDDIEASLSIMGQGGTAVIGGLALNEIEDWRFAEPTADDAAVPERYRQEIPNAYGYGHAPLLQAVIDRLKTGDTTAPIGAEEGAKSLSIVHALYRSMEVGGWVDLSGDATSRRLGVGPG